MSVEVLYEVLYYKKMWYKIRFVNLQHCQEWNIFQMYKCPTEDVIIIIKIKVSHLKITCYFKMHVKLESTDFTKRCSVSRKYGLEILLMPILASFWVCCPFHVLLKPVSGKFSARGSVSRSIVNEIMTCEIKLVVNSNYTTTTILNIE